MGLSEPCVFDTPPDGRLPRGSLWHVWFRDSEYPETWNVHACWTHAEADMVIGAGVQACDCPPEDDRWCQTVLIRPEEERVLGGPDFACGWPGLPVECREPDAVDGN